LLKRNALEAELKHAFAALQLVLHYQPIFDGDQRMTGVEALLRWPHARMGWVSPTEFIPIAEQSGLIIPVGLWVLETACHVLAKWARSPRHAHWTMAVNVSAAQIRQPDFVDQILATIARSGCNPHQLKLELTESLLQHDIEESIAKMNQLRATGIQFSIDDFGTGYSSLTYLRRLPISVLKIDRSFVKAIEHDVDDQAICQTILALGRALNLSIVAEGVETMEQFSLLLQSGCDRFQGFLFSKALPLDVLEKTLA
jgi:EAL domain-containing protein (putative c-di-GMP-specific phosphodiesterase class I)